ncbi:Multidrug transporter MdfA [Microbacterium oleivorans]|uniref:MFS transporter n=1 Tax=Microbacterium oleivorans TaxID=273677 RepID=UPI0009776483|nr:MFS transporter [Microbacterium oleivorans]AZS45177.1 Multidrug transporter MdfA [Microbacterium oleivorans]
MTSTIELPPTATAPAVASRRLSHRSGFWVTAITFLVLMAFNTVPTPLYALYQERDGFPTFLITVMFSAYSVGVMISLYLAGHLSDRIGRRPLILAATAIEIVAAVMFVLWQDTGGLVASRLVAGLGIGILTASATAHLADLHRAHRPDSPAFAATVAGIANMGGLALGPLVGGLFAEFAPAPLVLPYVVFLLAFLGLGFAYALVPETVERPAERFRYRPQRVRIPADGRRAYWAAGIAAFAAFAVTGLFGSVAPTFLARILGQTDHLLAGAVTFSVFGAAAAAQVVFARLTMRDQLRVGIGAMITGLLLLGAADLLGSGLLFVAGGVVAGAGVGLLFRGALAIAGSLSEPRTRSEITSGIFLLAFAGMTVPPLAVGAALLVVPIVPVFLAFVVLVLALTIWAGGVVLRESVGRA